MHDEPTAAGLHTGFNSCLLIVELLERRTLLNGVAFEPQQLYSVGSTPYAVAVGDLNHDGAADIVSANSGSNDVSVLMGRGDGTFQVAQSVAVDDQPHAVAIADLNNDGKLDIAT